MDLNKITFPSVPYTLGYFRSKDGHS